MAHFFKFFSLSCLLILPCFVKCQLEDLNVQWDALQCGGFLYKGPTKCKKGLNCLRKSKWYYQCRKSCPSDWECTLSTLTTHSVSTMTDGISSSTMKQDSKTTKTIQTSFQSTGLTKILKTKHETDIQNTITTEIDSSTIIESNATTIAIPVDVPNENNITWSEFMNAVIQNNYPKPNKEQYETFVTKIKKYGGIDSKREAAMFLAQILWESGGLKHKVEIDCKETGCPGQYSSGIGAWGKSYYGRGYIQLSWDYNYKAASLALFGDDRLLKDPDMVAKSEELCWQTALWFWKQNVGILKKKVKKLGQFGTTTNVINGGLECKGPYGDKARKRFNIYTIVLKAFNINEAPKEIGCYN